MLKSVLFSILTFFCLQVLAQEPPANPAEEATAEEGTETNQPQNKISKIQEFLSPFAYDREILRDPFETQSNNAPLKPGQVYGPFLTSQNYRLNDFKLKGMIWQTKNPVAVFRAPDKSEFRLKIKDYIGENFGYIAAIREKEVVVIQTIEENNRRYSTTKVVFLGDKDKK